MKITLDKSCVEPLEYDIRPPMRVAATLQVRLDGRHTSVAVYVSTSPFDLGVAEQREAEELLRRVVARLQVRP